MDYGEILYKPNNESFQNKTGNCLTITGAIQGTSRETIFDESGLHSLTI